jgi:hypothetical protein
MRWYRIWRHESGPRRQLALARHTLPGMAHTQDVDLDGRAAGRKRSSDDVSRRASARIPEAPLVIWRSEGHFRECRHWSLP